MSEWKVMGVAAECNEHGKVGVYGPVASMRVDSDVLQVNIMGSSEPIPREVLLTLLRNAGWLQPEQCDHCGRKPDIADDE